MFRLGFIEAELLELELSWRTIPWRPLFIYHWFSVIAEHEGFAWRLNFKILLPKETEEKGVRA